MYRTFCFHVVFAAAAAGLITLTASGDDLRLENALPERTAIAVDLIDTQAMFEKLQAAGILEAGEGASAEDTREALLAQLPDEVAQLIAEVIGDRAPMDVLAGVRLGFGAWPKTGATGTLPLAGAAWVHLGELAEAAGKLIDEQLKDARQGGSAQSESIGGVDVDLFGKSLDGEQVYLLHRSPWVLASTTQPGMERMLDALNDEPAEALLGETEAWMEAVEFMRGAGGLRVALFPEVLLDAYQLSPDGQMIGMVRPVIRDVLGRHEVFAARVDAGKDGTLLRLDGGSWMPDGVEGLLDVLENGPPNHAAVRRFGGTNMVAVTELHVQFGQITSVVEALLRSSPLLFAVQGPFKELRPTIEAFLRPLGTHAVQLMSVVRPVSADSMHSLWVVEVTDREAMADALAASLGTGGFDGRDFQGHQIWSMDIPALLPGIPAETMAISAAGGWLFIGADPSVEQALRSLSERGTEAPWIKHAPRVATDGDATVRGMLDLQDFFGVISDIQRLQQERIRTALQESDPELWEELAGDMDIDNASPLEQGMQLAKKFGVFGWKLTREDHGFRLVGVVTAAEGD